MGTNRASTIARACTSRRTRWSCRRTSCGTGVNRPVEDCRPSAPPDAVADEVAGDRDDGDEQVQQPERRADRPSETTNSPATNSSESPGKEEPDQQPALGEDDGQDAEQAECGDQGAQGSSQDGPIATASSADCWRCTSTGRGYRPAVSGWASASTASRQPLRRRWKEHEEAADGVRGVAQRRELVGEVAQHDQPGGHASAPTMLADKKRGYDICPTPAMMGVNVRTHGIHRAATTANQP